MTHRPQIDGLRAIAAITVVAGHTHILPTALMLLHPHGLAVRTFFVLSGYLITGILLQARDEAEAHNRGLRDVFAAFYARRVLRIFPVYYAVVLLLYVCGHALVRTHPYLFMSYASNVMWGKGAWGGEDVGAAHLWSLAVEEQFYLVWPIVLLAVPRRWAPSLIACLIACGPIFRWINDPLISTRALTPAQLDSLGIGAMLAVAPQGVLSRWYVGALSLLAFGLLQTIDDQHVLIPFAWAMWSAYVVSGCVAGHYGWLQHRALTYVGTISYGLYVYHYPIQWAMPRVYLFLCGSKMPDDPYLLTLFVLPLTALIATASWTWFERPINELKRHVPYIQQRRLPWIAQTD